MPALSPDYRTGSGQPRFLYGMNYSLQPLPRRGRVASDWEWPPSRLSKLPRPDTLEQVPESSGNPPQGFTYPQAPIYRLNKDFDSRFIRGYFYSADFHLSTTSALKDHILRIKTPPNVVPNRYDPESQTFVTKPLQGMTQMAKGITYVHHIDGDPQQGLTVAALHTIETVKQLSPNGDRVESCIGQLYQSLFGRPPTHGDPGLLPLYQLEGLKPNKRSALPTAGSYDGSYSLAGTKVEGRGRGIYAPAVTSASSYAVSRIAEVNVLVHTIFRDVIEVTVMKEELAVLDFHGIHTNIFSAGGIAPANTSVQMNVSSQRTGGELSASIGDIQGKFHVDQSDCPPRLTMFLCFYKLAQGASQVFIR